MEFVRKIIARGADVNYQNKKGKTALYLLVEKGAKEKIIKGMIQFGANPH